MSDLPTGAEPLTLADGRVIMPNGRTQRAIEAPPTPVVLPITHVTEVQPKKLDDLPDKPRVMNAVCLVLAYKLFGLSAEDIAHAVGTDAGRVDRILASDAYADMHRAVVRGVLDSEAAGIRDLFQHYSRAAVSTLVDSLENGKRADRIAAARDLLDRAGHRPADVVEHRLRMEGGLTIEVIRRDGNTDVPTINMENFDD